MKYQNENINIFHVHTYRCGHAGNDMDEQYVKKAINLGASSITFTDHAPFPKNPFGNRMLIEQLPEYIYSLNKLKKYYKSVIDVRIGLEIEYLSKFADYYDELKKTGCFDVLMLGQHFYECADGKYNFEYDKSRLREEEPDGIYKAVIEGISTGLFEIVAHPDRMFRYCGKWNEKMEQMSLDIINTAQKYNIILEQNLSSMKNKGYYRKEFWNLVPEGSEIIIGMDAHSVNKLEEMSQYIGMERRKIC